VARKVRIMLIRERTQHFCSSRNFSYGDRKIGANSEYTDNFFQKFFCHDSANLERLFTQLVRILHNFAKLWILLFSSSLSFTRWRLCTFKGILFHWLNYYHLLSY